MTKRSLFRNFQLSGQIALGCILSVAILETTMSQAMADDEYDPCWIHTDCEKPVGYSNNPKSSMGVGWYCTDGKLVTKETKFDFCKIQTGCKPELGRSPQYMPKMSEGGQAGWRCLDNAFIHTNCTTGAGYSQKGGSLGIGWYCKDNKYVDKTTKFDKAYIHPGCTSGVKYDNTVQAWLCNE